MHLDVICPSCTERFEAGEDVSDLQSRCPHCGNAVAVPESRLDSGSTLGGFRLERRLGRGGMGEVFLATQLSVKRQVAVKVLPGSFAADSRAVQRFLREGRLAARLDHFNIITVLEAGEDSGNYFLAMAYIEGESLDQRLKREEVLPEAEALVIVRTVADALAYAWETFRLLHRDLKPGNIMVDRRGRVFLMDLGLAKSLGDESGMSLAGAILGTPQYMSPEQAQGVADLGVPTDVYALGATLYHLVTGTPPFAGDTTLRVLHKLMNEPLPPPRDRNPKVTESCSHLLEAMMAKESAERYSDWRAVIADVDRVLKGALPVARRDGGPRQATGPAGASAVSSASGRAGEAGQAQQAALAPVVPPATRRSRWLARGLMATVVVILAVTGGVTVLQRGKTPAPGRLAVASAAAAEQALSDLLRQTAGSPLLGDRDRIIADIRKHCGGDLRRVQMARELLADFEKEWGSSATGKEWAPAVQEALSTWTIPDLGLELAWVAPGSFQMGSTDGTGKPVHAVRISRGFWIGRYEVTQREYKAIEEKDPSDIKGVQNPVDHVSWDDGVAFCTLVTERERAAGRIPDGYEYRLPTEAEWEYAARGGTASRGYTYAGSDDPYEVAWHTANSEHRSHPVGRKQPNELGLYDMSGNLWEWCLDAHDEGYYTRSPDTDPVNTDAPTHRVIRGGGWCFDANFLPPAFRARDLPIHAWSYIGFRVCLAPQLGGK